MRRRCDYPKNPKWEYYGGRGIRVCDEWQAYETFRDWALANGYADNLTLDRINVDGNYEPSNCRWLSRAAQNRNYRRNVFVEIDGERLSPDQLAERAGVTRQTITHRLRRGDPIKVLLRPKHARKAYFRT